MTSTARLRLIWHGAIVLLVGLLVGLPTVVEASTESMRVWHTAHEALIMMGIWMLAASSAVPVLVLGQREARALMWAYLAMGYGFMIALLIGGVMGISPFEPGKTPVAFIAFLASVIGILGAVMATALTLMGARAALKRPQGE